MCMFRGEARASCEDALHHDGLWAGKVQRKFGLAAQLGEVLWYVLGMCMACAWYVHGMCMVCV